MTRPHVRSRTWTHAVAACLALGAVGGCRSEARPHAPSDTALAGAVVVRPDADANTAHGPAITPAVSPASTPAIITAAGPLVPGGPALDATGDELAVLSAGLMVPVAGILVSDLHDTFDEARGSRRHDALDIAAARGTRVLSATDGRLLKMYDSKAGGLMVYAADPSERFVLLYGHLDRYAPGLVEGMPLRRGQYLGDVGTTGNAPPGVPHLHFGISRVADTREWWRGTPINPHPLFAG